MTDKPKETETPKAPFRPPEKTRGEKEAEAAKAAKEVEVSHLGPALAAIDKAGKEIKKALDSLWVPFDERTGTGGVHWHAQAAAHLKVALQELTAIEEKLRPLDWVE